ncbi:hypothetical protein OIU85_009492 [Salix viminalis]|uniref:Transmembrane protein n=1 Tax=Salix viminalis TaxID=40686 RepID=A0A9Q0NUM2_SALVM|nr:hypothetical protein OIU85_009492 [Salix viminalis]
MQFSNDNLFFHGSTSKRCTVSLWPNGQSVQKEKSLHFHHFLLTLMNRILFSLVHASFGACFLYLFFMPRHYAKLSNKTKNKEKGKKHSVYVYEGIISNYCLLISV